MMKEMNIYLKNIHKLESLLEKIYKYNKESISELLNFESIVCLFLQLVGAKENNPCLLEKESNKQRSQII